MKLTNKSRSLLMRAFMMNREISTFDENTEKELINSGLVRYTTKPMMTLTRDGKHYCANRQRIAEHG